MSWASWMRWPAALAGLALVTLAAIWGATQMRAAGPTATPSAAWTPHPRYTPTPCDKCMKERPERPTPTPTSRPVGANVGQQAPDFGLTALGGRTVHLSDYRGQVVLLNFWATWCGYCQMEIPGLAAAYTRYKERGFTVLAVDILEPRSTVQSFVMGTPTMVFPVLLDLDGRVGQLYRVRPLPTTFVIDREGIISSIHPGMLDDQALRQLAEPLLGM